MADKSSADGGLRELALFAGAGGGMLGGHLLGWRTVCAVEWEPYAACILAARQNDGLLPPFPIWDDVQTFDGRPWRGIVDVVSGGFPCQDISIAGKGDGLDGERSGLWREMARVVGEVRPRYVYIENSPMLTSRGGARVIADLTSLGYDTQWDVMGAADVGAPHQRDRIWVVAEMADSSGIGLERWPSDRNSIQKQSFCESQQNDRYGVWREVTGGFSLDNWKSFAMQFCGMDDGVAARVDRLKAIGNGQVPAVAAAAWSLLTDCVSERPRNP